ncbi:uncharacterized protein LOC121298885 [Polyodon spathula]|uniref:uncharacterized protein LOC121298885 n=1 Tax=Polyodon spathula TaxID=7913 RepID=UPI001B7E025B|nr:uncharacterized protein LOC121298885 [Polyodon spathula]
MLCSRAHKSEQLCIKILSTEKLLAFIDTLRVHPFVKTPDKPSSPQEGAPVKERLRASLGVSIGGRRLEGDAGDCPGTVLPVEPLRGGIVASRVPEHGQPGEKAAAGELGSGALEGGQGGAADESSRGLESLPPAGCAGELRGVVLEGARRPRRGERRRAGESALAEWRVESVEVWDLVGLSGGAERAPPDTQTEVRHQYPETQLPPPRYRCVECGARFGEETALHEHYNQHAIGEQG